MEDPPTNILVIQEKAELSMMARSALIAILPGFGAGMSLSFTTPALDHYKSADVDQPFSKEQGSWFVSLPLIAVMLGNLSSGLFTDRLGRKRTLVLSTGLLLAGWAALWPSGSSFGPVLASRVVSGLGTGVANPAAFMMLSELSLAKYRAALGVANSVTINAAWLLALVLFGVMPFKVCLPIAAIPSALFLLLSYFLPESPLWCIKQGSVDEAEKTLRWLRGPNYPVTVELKELMHCVSSQGKVTLTQKVRYLTSTKVLKPVAIVAGMMFFQIACGCEALSYYSLEIFRSAGLSLNRYVLSCLIQAAFVFGYVTSAPFMAHVPRRSQFVFSGLIIAVSMTTLGSTLLAKENGSEFASSIYQVIGPTCLILSCYAYALGLGPVCYGLLGEIFPPRAKAVCCSIVCAFRFCIAFAALKLFPSLVSLVGLSGCFLVNSLCCVCGCLFVLFLLPETHGLTLTQLSELFGRSCEDDLNVEHEKEDTEKQEKEELVC